MTVEDGRAPVTEAAVVELLLDLLDVPADESNADIEFLEVLAVDGESDSIVIDTGSGRTFRIIVERLDAE